MQTIEALNLSSITVDTLLDENDGSLAKGDVSLREAIAAVQSGGSIRFDRALAQQDAGFGNGVIGLTLGELVIDKSMRIIGLGADELSVSGGYRSRVFLLDDGEAGAIDVAISGLTVAEGRSDDLAGGLAGGILSVGENLTFSDGELLANEGAIATAPGSADAAIAIKRSSVFANGEFGISTSGELRVVDSQLIKNAAVSIEHDGNLILKRSGISKGSDSGIVSSGGLSLIDSQVESNDREGIRHSGTAFIQNSSITGNLGEGIVGAGRSALNLVNSTIESNGASGIITSGVVTLKESSIANNAGSGIVFVTDQFDPSDFKIRNSFIVDNASGGIVVDRESYDPVGRGDSVIENDESENGGSEIIAPTKPVLPSAGRIEGSRGKDIIDGTNSNDIIRASMGNDIIDGKGGSDLIRGGKGSDWIYGGSGKDQIFGGASDDVLGGGKGRDQLRGGKGRDVFVFGGLHEGRDQILDFKVGADLIDLSAIFADEQYDSATPFDDYIQLGSAGAKGTRLSVLDLNRSTADKTVFKAIAIIDDVALSEISEKSFIL